FGFPRPFVSLPKSSVFAILPDVSVKQYWMSFPSGHSSFAMFMGVSLWPILNRYLKVIIGTLVILIGLSRVVLGMHFPADVVGGFILSFVIVKIVSGLLRKLLPSASRPLIS